MTLPCTLYPLGSAVSPYKSNQVLCNISNGQTADVAFYQGIYYIESQGSGGDGGEYAYPYGQGFGGGSGAGCKIYVRILKNFTATVTAGAVGTTKGGDTIIPNIITLGGGYKGRTVQGSPSGISDNGGAFTKEDEIFYRLLSGTIVNGNPANAYTGGNSVITNNGGAPANTSATIPGAGGGGSRSAGGYGKGAGGTCLIKFVRP